MAYGLKVEGTDAGGTFLVTDTNKNLRNLRVVDYGTNDTQITLDSALQPNDLLFVKNPQEPPGGWETFIRYYSSPEGGAPLTLYWSGPTYHYITLSSDEKTVSFKGGRVGSMGGSRGYVKWYAYQAWDVAFDWFLVRDVGQIVNDGLSSNETHGLQILTEEINGVQDIAFDSRAIINDKTFNINGVAPSSGSWGFENLRTQFTYGESGSYVNIEHTAVGASQYANGGYDGTNGGLRIRGIQVGQSGAYVYEGLLDFEPNGAGILWFPNNVALFSAKMYTGAPSGTGASDGSGTDTSGDDGTDESGSGVTELNGTIQLASNQDNKITEGTDATIVYNVGVNVSGDYNLKVERDSGSVGGGELSGTQKTFTGTSTSMSITANNDTSSEIGWQGENFTLVLRTGSTIGSGTVVQSSSFTLYDDDLSITLVGTSGTRFDIDNDATYAYIDATFASAGNIQVAGRVKTSSGTVASTFNFVTPYGNQQVPVSLSYLPGGQGTTSTTTENYTLEVYTGNAWLSTPFSIRRLAGSSSNNGVAQSSPSLESSYSNTISTNDTSITINYSGMTVGEQLRMVDASGNISSATITAQAVFVGITINSNLPSSGSKVYTPQVKATGGSWTPKTGGNVSVTRSTGSQGPGNGFGGGDFGNNQV